jgi:hypothetical protein
MNSNPYNFGGNFANGNFAFGQGNGDFPSNYNQFDGYGNYQPTWGNENALASMIANGNVQVMNRADFFNSLRQSYPQPVIQRPIPGIGQPYAGFQVNPADYGLPVADYGGEAYADVHVNPADYGMPIADYGGEANPYASWWPAGAGVPIGPQISPEIVGEAPYETETLVYGAISIVVVAVFGYLGRRFYNDYAAQNNIKKEINKRFRFGDKEERKQTQRDQRESLVEGNGQNPLGPSDEEAKSNSDHAPVQEKPQESMMTKSINMFKSSAQQLAAKVNFSQVEVEDDDPAKYHQLDDGNNDKTTTLAAESTTRVWSQDGATLIEKKGMETQSASVNKSSFVKVKASVVAEMPAELEDVNLDNSEEQNGNFMMIDEAL